MSVLVFIETNEGEIKSSSLEAVCYAKSINENVVAIMAGEASSKELDILGKYGVTKVFYNESEALANDSQGLAEFIFSGVEKEGADLIIIARSSLADSIAPKLAIKAKASIATNVVDLPSSQSPLTVKRGVFTGKAFATVSLPEGRKVLTLAKNAVGLKESPSSCSSEKLGFSEVASPKVKRLSVEKATGSILLPEADKVVSAGRGLKGPENWEMIEELANTLGAATACSKPVSDMEWRPHHEHVGQTGIKVSPSLYIAIGISGAIQHLAGVNSSKTIVVINKDAEAPFFKSADYGIVGDAFEVVPKLTEAIKRVV